MESENIKNTRKKNPRATANILSILTFSWILPFFWDGYNKDLNIDDLPEALKEHSSGHLGNKLQKAWEEEVAKAKQKRRKPSFLSTLIKVFGFKLALIGLTVASSEIGLRIAQPLFLGGLIRYFSQPADAPGKLTKEDAYMFAFGVIFCSGFNVLVMHPYFMAIAHLGMKIRVAVCSLIYRQALKLTKSDLGHTTAGQVVNLLSNDVNRFDIWLVFFHLLWIGPLQSMIVTYIVWRQMGVAAFIGLATLLGLIPLQAWLGKKSSSLRLKTAARTDERVRLMNEIISGIQVIKMYTWEKPFASLVEHARKKEINVISQCLYIKGIMLSFIIFHTRTAIFLTILCYVLLGNEVNAEKVFVLSSFYSTLRQTMTVFFPQGITQVAEGLISVKRVQNFLMINEKGAPYIENLKIEQLNGKQNMKEPLIKPVEDQHYKHVINENEKHGIFIKNATAKWIPSSHENTLTNVTLDVTPGILAAVIGPVGSGKTSLFHAILNELPLSSGLIELNGKVSYASQEPWLFQASVRQNILFGLEYNRERYRQVTKVCCLKTDFEQLPYGDKTIVGERGVSLSGGQRARINLARAVYKEADIYLLDDPLSAVDTHVGKHLFEDCIKGYLKKKTVILITHQLQYLDVVDQIVLLENGSVKAMGDYKTLQRSGLDFTKMLNSQEPERVEEIVAVVSRNSQTMGSRQSIQSTASSVFDDTINISNLPVIVSESQGQGSVSGKVYKVYLAAGGGCCLVLFMFFMCFFAQMLACAADYWVAYWVNVEEYMFHMNPDFLKSSSAAQSNITTVESNITTAQSNIISNNDTHQSGIKFNHVDPPYFYLASRDVCIYIFSGITMATIVITLIRSFMFFNLCMKSSIKLHNRMFTCITHATMWFFNNNTSGRILNRFSKDMGAIDELLPLAMMDVIQISIALLGIVIVVTSVSPLLMLPVFVAAVVFYYMRNFYISTSRNVKRLEGVTRSPVFTHVNASILGLTTIRAFEAEHILVNEFDNHQDLHSSAWFLFIASSRAFGYWLDLVCFAYIALVTLSFLVLGGENFGGNVGLAISQSIGLTGMFQWGMRQSTELENQMTSVERVLEYSELESEPPLESPPDKKPRKTWPERGKVEFSDVFLRYSSSDPWVLKNLNFTIMPEEKVGIVGRTGAGKSSLIAALFRLTEVDGSILIDGIDTGSLGLHEVRSKISIIPQEPVLFSATLRKNLDPFDEHSDDVLWNTLEEVELKEVVHEMPGGLQAVISEGGSNLSVGQRQLVCLARAIVRNNKILVLDEATANVDPQTDSFIQETIREKFANCTVLTIAHRLNTVMDSDKILVMDAGTMVEFDHPHVLLQNPNSVLSGMVHQTGKATEEILKNVAQESYEKRKLQGSSQSQESSVI